MKPNNKTCADCYLSKLTEVIGSGDEAYVVCRKDGGVSMPMEASSPACEEYVAAKERREEQARRESFDDSIYPIIDKYFQDKFQKMTFSEYKKIACACLEERPMKDVQLGAWEFNNLLNLIFDCFRRSKKLGVEIWKDDNEL